MSEEAAPPLPAATPPPSDAWRTWLGAGVSLGLLGLIVVQLDNASAAAAAMLRQLSPAVWATLAVLYFVQPLADLAIYRRLWGLPLAGFPALLRKTAINEVVLGYGGELYLYLWARGRTDPGRARPEVIKDVAILSALLGNLLTLAMLVLSAAKLADLDVARRFGPTLWWGAGAVTLTTIALAFTRRIFTLGRRDVAFVAGVHAIRLAAVNGLTLAAWSLALPHVPFGAWLVLLAVRLGISRLPFVANRDLVFGNLLLVLTPQAPVAVLLATLALATLGAHLSVIPLLSAGDLWRFAFRRGSGR
jgi:hypothetical protein